MYRSENDKILGGVCSGLANYLRLDPSIIRIIFALMMFGGGVGFLLYLILWVVLPPKSLVANTRKRLYRNSDDRVIAGVASGIAAYFHMEVWIWRVLFALPLIGMILSSLLHGIFGHSFFHPEFYHPGTLIFGGFTSTLVLAYIILWVILPEAVSASEKLEMRGESRPGIDQKYHQERSGAFQGTR